MNTRKPCWAQATTGSVLLSLGLAVGGCAGTPERNLALQEAQQTYAAASHDSEVVRHAAAPLRDAEQTLRRAENVREKDGDPEEVQHLSYLAEEKVALARAQTERAQAQVQAEALSQEAAEFARLEAISNAQETERGLVLTLGDVLFESGRADLTLGVQLDIQPLLVFLKEHPDHQVVTEGHTDSVGDEAYNTQLSQERAVAVAAYFIANGVSPERIGTYGLGERYPVASNAQAAGRQQNRRVEVIVLHRGQTYRFPDLTFLRG